MSDSTNPQQPTADPRSEALEWLAGQFRWESLLSDLHDLSERESAPMVEIKKKSGLGDDEQAA